MLSIFNSKFFVFLAVFVLIMPAIVFSSGYSFANISTTKHESSQKIPSVPEHLSQTIEREEFWFPVMIWPVSNPVVSSGFGHRDSSCRLCSSDHRGVDFTPGRGSEIFAVMDGVVVDAGSMGTYGSAVLIEHPNGWQTLYAHMIPGSITVSAGDSVVQGKAIGLVGSSGVSTGAHLHFEIVIDGVQKNPMPILNELTKK